MANGLYDYSLPYGPLIDKQVIIILNLNLKYDLMPKQVSALNTFLIVRYVDEHCPKILMTDIVDEINSNHTYFVENLKTGKVEPISIEHLSNIHYWFSNKFMMDLYGVLQRSIPDPELALKIGKTSYKSQHIFKTAIGIPLIGPYRLIDRISKENRKYNRTKENIILKNSSGHVIVRLIHKKNIIINDFAMMWHAGVFESYAKLAGATDVRVHVRCVEKGPRKYGDPGQGIWDFDIRFKDHNLFERLFNSFLCRIPMVRDIIDNANKIQEEHNEQILYREKIIKERTDKLRNIQNKLFEEERKKIKEELRNISNELIVTEERERHLLAEDLHDSVSQSLAISLVKIESMLGAKNCNDPRKDELMDVKDYVKQAISEMRSVTFQICPPILYDFGLEAALEWLIKDINHQNEMMIVFTNNIKQPLRVNETIKILMYRSARELIINIIKHAKTQDAQITLAVLDNKVTVRIKDNGIGFDVDQVDKINSLSFGLFSISKRFQALKGKIEIYSEQNKGTDILLTAPLTDAVIP